MTREILFYIHIPPSFSLTHISPRPAMGLLHLDLDWLLGTLPLHAVCHSAVHTRNTEQTQLENPVYVRAQVEGRRCSVYYIVCT